MATATADAPVQTSKQAERASGWTPRAGAVLASAAAATAVWAVARYAAGVDVHSPGMNGHSPATVTAGMVITVSVIAGLAGWTLLALLERFTTRARTAWTITAIAVAVLSLGGPLSGTGVTSSSRTVLALLHVTVALTLIPLLRRTAQTS